MTAPLYRRAQPNQTPPVCRKHRLPIIPDDEPPTFTITDTSKDPLNPAATKITGTITLSIPSAPPLQQFMATWNNTTSAFPTFFQNNTPVAFHYSVLDATQIVLLTLTYPPAKSVNFFINSKTLALGKGP